MAGEVIIAARVINKEQFQANLARAPGLVKESIFKWLVYEGTAFIGTRTKDGIMRREMSRKTKWLGGQWRSQVMGLFKFRVVDAITGQAISRKGLIVDKSGMLGGGAFGTGISMSLKMGMMYNTQKQIHKAMEFLESGGDITSNKYMPIPLKDSGIGKAYTKFKSWLKAGDFYVLYKGGKAFYFLKRATLRSEKESLGKLMFVGLKRVKINWHHSFNQKWSLRQIGVIDRAGAAVDRAIAKV